MGRVTGRQVSRLILGLVLLALGAQGCIRLLVNHNPGALRHLPGGYSGHLAIWAVMAVLGFTLVRKNKITGQISRTDPEPKAHGHRR